MQAVGRQVVRERERESFYTCHGRPGPGSGKTVHCPGSGKTQLTPIWTSVPRAVNFNAYFLPTFLCWFYIVNSFTMTFTDSS